MEGFGEEFDGVVFDCVDVYCDVVVIGDEYYW